MMLERVRAGIADSAANLKRLTGVDLPESQWPALGPRVDWAAELATRVGLNEYPLESDELVSGVHFQDFTHVGLHHYYHHGRCSRVRLVDLLVESSELWASRSYRMCEDNRVEYCAFLDTEKEHDSYWQIGPGDRSIACAYFYRCFSENAGGQGLQIVHRFGEVFGSVVEVDFRAMEDINPGGPIVIREYLMRNAGHNFEHGRNAFAVSIFAIQKFDKTMIAGMHDLHATRLFIDKSMQPKAQGLLLVQGRPRALVKDSIFLAGEEQLQPIALLDASMGGGELYLVNNLFHGRGGQAKVEIRGWKKLWISGCEGNVRVQRDTKDLGPISEIHGWL